MVMSGGGDFFRMGRGDAVRGRVILSGGGGFCQGVGEFCQGEGDSVMGRGILSGGRGIIKNNCIA